MKQSTKSYNQWELHGNKYYVYNQAGIENQDIMICKAGRAWNCNATTSKLEVVGNLWHRYDNSSPRYSARTTMLSLYTFESFSGFQLTR